MTLEASVRYGMDNFAKYDYQGMNIVGQHWNEETANFETVALPVMIIDRYQADPGIYIIDGQPYWCEWGYDSL